MSVPEPGKFHGSGGHSKRSCLQDRINFHRSQTLQIVPIFNTVTVYDTGHSRHISVISSIVLIIDTHSSPVRESYGVCFECRRCDQYSTSWFAHESRSSDQYPTFVISMHMQFRVVLVRHTSRIDCIDSNLTYQEIWEFLYSPLWYGPIWLHEWIEWFGFISVSRCQQHVLTYCSLVSIGSGNDLVPSGTKPLPEPMILMSG